MASTAPYYQSLRTSSYQNGSPTSQSYAPAEEDYHLAASAAPHAPMYANLAHDGSALEGLSSQAIAEQHLNGAESLAGLLEAVTSAAGQEQAARGGTTARGKSGRATRNSQNQNQLNGHSDAAQNRAKRKRSTTPGTGDYKVGQENDDTPVAARKRRKRTLNTESDPDDSFPIHDAFPPALGDARAAGVHSAAALFRQPSTNSKKYTRPPMSKLFASLQLSPENFLHLQAAAKAYMLNPDYPERQSCVGNRGKGDTDMVKLRLFNCVRDFLSDSVGERFFGENADPPGEGGGEAFTRNWLWPRDASKIISLVTPLLRRMVTNERQRVYAIETRKGGSAVKKGRGTDGESAEDMPQAEMSAPAPGYMPAMSAPDDYGHLQPPDPSQTSPTFPETHALDPALSSVQPENDSMIHVFVVKNNFKILPRIDVAFASSRPLTYQEVEYIVSNEIQHISGNDLGEPGTNQNQNEAIDPANGESAAENPAAGGNAEMSGQGGADRVGTFAHSSRGLVPLLQDEDWSSLMEDIRNNVWMENVIKVVVELS